MTFDDALRPTLIFECGGDPKTHDGYVNDPDDPGGETKYGIAKRYWPMLDIKNLTYDQARQLYYSEYWERYRCELIPDHLRGIYFDMCVIPGPRQAAKLLQMACNSIGYTLKVDGIVGLKTLTAAIDLPPDRLRMYRLEYFADQAVKTPSKAKFWNGWKRRAITI